MAEQWQPDYSKVMDLYKKLEEKGLKGEADKVMAGISKKYTAEHSAPPEEIQHGLEGILAKHGHEGGEIHQQHKPAQTRMDYFMQMAATLAGIAVFGMYLV